MRKLVKKMHSLKINKILKPDFLKLEEESIMFITNPGRMGDEDGITFVVKNDNEYISYRVSGWMYGSKEKDNITLDEARKQFPEWYKAWENGTDEDYKGKYKHLYMGFGNGLNVDISIYDKFKPYLDKMIKNNLEKYPEEERKDRQYAAIFNVWEDALINMAQEENIILK